MAAFPRTSTIFPKWFECHLWWQPEGLMGLLALILPFVQNIWDGAVTTDSALYFTVGNNGRRVRLTVEGLCPGIVRR